jgi:hypothetical protein
MKFDRRENDITTESRWLFLKTCIFINAVTYLQHINNLSPTYFNTVFNMKKTSGRNGA